MTILDFSKKPKTEHKDETKYCNICKLGIDESKEFAEFTHYTKKDNILSKAFYHINCFRERMLGAGKLNELQDKANRILEMASARLA